MNTIPHILRQHVGYYASAGSERGTIAPQLAPSSALPTIAALLRGEALDHIADEIERGIAKGKTRKIIRQLRHCNLYACHDGAPLSYGCRFARHKVR